ncbi:MAG: hypothetical protein HS101_17960 [Planctomycetia bacterium]|nr:hypothetical protein [Planctomycetia bacterium]
MNREALEHLIIDRRLGELPNDVALLLDAYLHASPDANSTVQEVEATLTMTKQAVHTSSTNDTTLPSFPSSRIAAAMSDRPRRPSHLLRWPVALAATLALGVFLGTRTKLPTSPRPVQSIPVVFHEVSDDAPGDFWSLSPRQTTSTSSSTSTKHLEWSSPLNWPVKGESL